MAAGDVTLDVGTPRQMGSYWVATGTVEVDDTLRTFDLVGPRATLVDLTLVNVNGTGTAKSALNVDANGATVNGSAAIQAGDEALYISDPEAVESYRFIAHFI